MKPFYFFMLVITLASCNTGKYYFNKRIDGQPATVMQPGMIKLMFA
ncbi:MAG TPA: hypothetical protein VD905_21270 [Flavobacteriales bacterium]|nr:hypothetical protein [Flavobacteriales bacterium]